MEGAKAFLKNLEGSQQLEVLQFSNTIPVNKMLTFAPLFRQQPCIYLVSAPKGITFKVMRSSLCQGGGEEVKGQGCLDWLKKGDFNYFFFERI